MTELNFVPTESSEDVQDVSLSVVPPEQGPCTVSEARDLLRSAADAADTFATIVTTILRRKAWEPLGYSSPQEMLQSEITGGKLLNPTTNKPYSRAHIYRLISTATAVLEIERRTGVEPDLLNLSPKLLQQARTNGVDPTEVIAEIESTVSDRGVVDVIEVQEIADAAFKRAAGQDPTSDTEPSSDESSTPHTPALSGRRTPEDNSPLSSDTEDTAPTDDDQSDRPETTDTAQQQSGDVQLPSDEDVAMANRFVEFLTFVRAYNSVSVKLPKLLWIQEQLPDILDHADETEQDELVEELDDLHDTLSNLPNLLKAINEIVAASNELASEHR